MRKALIIRGLLVISLLLGLTAGLIVLVFAQIAEVEPNDTFATAQDMEYISLPSLIQGNLYRTENDPKDVDFFRFEGTPNSKLQIDLEGLPTGQGTLSDPYLGLYDSTCNQVAVNDDYNGLNSRLYVTVPSNGIYVMAVSSCCDYDFDGDGYSSGTYQMTVTPLVSLGSITGQVMDAETGDPVSGSEYPRPGASLYSCRGDDCGQRVHSTDLDYEGKFRFETDSYGNPLPVGTYTVSITATMYAEYLSEPFDVAEGEHKDLGRINLIPLPTIGSIEGRAVDTLDGTPLPGDVSPYANVYLRRCPEPNDCDFIAWQRTDSQGRFRFVSGNSENQIPIGQYKVEIWADQYQKTESTLFDVAEDQDLNIGDIPVQPYPVQFLEIQPCSEIPAQGGLCRYSVEIRNGLTQKLHGSAWTVVRAYEIGSFTDWSIFPGGTPRTINLSPGDTTILQFTFPVPGSVDEGAHFYTRIFVGQEPHAIYNTIGEDWLFCVFKGSEQFTLLPENEAREFLRKKEQQLLWPTTSSSPNQKQTP